ncbi:MAG: hypothetical protein ACTSP4_12930 [Candidatus Hodarchaeales archaeon]
MTMSGTRRLLSVSRGLEENNTETSGGKRNPEDQRMNTRNTDRKERDLLLEESITHTTSRGKKPLEFACQVKDRLNDHQGELINQL